MAARVAVAVVSWNTRELLDECLASLRDAAADVWVVDNASADGSAAMVAERHPWARLIALQDNRGYGGAVALVARESGAEFLAAANSDIRVEPGAIDVLLDAADRRPRAGALAPRLLLRDGATQHSVHPFPTIRLGLALSAGLAQRAPLAPRLPMEGAWDAAVERDVDWAHGAFLLVRRSAWDEVGGFDPQQWLYAEDLDLCWRLRRAGWTTRYVPDARVHHAVSAATSGRWDAGARAVVSQRSAYAWLLARRGRAYTRAVALAHLAGPAARGALLGAAARRSPERFAARAAAQRAYARMHRTGLEPVAALEAHRRGQT